MEATAAERSVKLFGTRCWVCMEDERPVEVGLGRPEDMPCSVEHLLGGWRSVSDAWAAATPYGPMERVLVLTSILGVWMDRIGIQKAVRGPENSGLGPRGVYLFGLLAAHLAEEEDTDFGKQALAPDSHPMMGVYRHGVQLSQAIRHQVEDRLMLKPDVPPTPENRVYWEPQNLEWTHKIGVKPPFVRCVKSAHLLHLRSGIEWTGQLSGDASSAISQAWGEIIQLGLMTGGYPHAAYAENQECVMVMEPFLDGRVLLVTTYYRTDSIGLIAQESQRCAHELEQELSSIRSR